MASMAPTAPTKIPSAASLSNSTRSIEKVTYVPLIPLHHANLETGHAVLKSGFVKQLILQPGEIDHLVSTIPKETLRSAQHSSLQAIHKSTWATLRQFEGNSLPSQLPLPAAFDKIPSSQLAAVGNAISSVRKEAYEQKSSKNALETAIFQNLDLGTISNLANVASTSVNAFNANTSVPPIGMLNLERLEMMPAGIEQGELIATIPLAPREKTSVVQKQWSVVSQEFTSIVTDSLENYSETGVTENTELAQATNSQNAHSNQFNVTASASGSCGFVSGSASTSFMSQGKDSTSAADSRKHAVTTTRKASSRVKQAHKVTISTKTESGTSESTTRTLENTSTTEPMRIDYFAMMRKWHVGLYRYGLRMTYDITIPEPAAAMREIYKEMHILKKKLDEGFKFDLDYSQITDGGWPTLASKYGAQISAGPPQPTRFQTLGGQIPNLVADDTGNLIAYTLNFTVDPGYEIDKITLDLELSDFTQNRRFDLMGVANDLWQTAPPAGTPAGPPGLAKQSTHAQLTGSNGLPFLQGAQGNQVITGIVGGFGNGVAWFTLYTKRTEESFNTWVSTTWGALFNAAQASFYETQSQRQSRYDDLQAKIKGVDTLTLRREENDEIMKGVLRWILGTNFEFMPSAVTDLFNLSSNDTKYGVSFTGNSIGPNIPSWSIVYQYEAMVNFINQAIEWENVVYFLYSYFWDMPSSWDFIRQIEHPDATRQAFLRAGASRVVLTVRKGYETAWTWFAEHGDIVLPTNIPNDPYMPIAQQIHNYDNTNYPGIPPANPDGSGPVDDGAGQVGTTCKVDISPGASPTTPVKIAVADSTGFQVGATAIIDEWDSGVQETQSIIAVGADSITVQGLQHEHVAKNPPFPIVQSSEKGVLIGEWFEYTPSNGTLISVNSKLGAMA